MIDNASIDASLERLADVPSAQIVRLPENRGFSGAANEGILRSRSPFVLLLNPDIEVVPESVRMLYQEIQSHPNAAIICGALKDENGNSQEKFQIRPFPNWRSVTSDVLFLDELWDWVRKQSRDREGVGPCSNALSRVEDSSLGSLPPGRGSVCCRHLRSEQPAAAFWMLRKTSWEDVGGFDPRFHPAWFEDVDFCKRLLAAGWQIVYCPDLPIIHRGGLSVSALGYPAFVTVFYQNLLKYLKKHHPVSYPLLWLPVNCGIWVRRRLARKWKQLPAHRS